MGYNGIIFRINQGLGVFNRTIAATIQEVNNSFPVLLITGPRQVGKTTVLEMCQQEGRNYVTLDDLDVRSMAQNDPGLFLQTYKAPLIIDEIQYAPELFSYIKIAVDQNKQNGMFWLTGSQKFRLMRGVNESLAGRVAIIDLLGLSQAELLNYNNKPFLPSADWLEHADISQASIQNLTQVYKQIWYGSFPKINLERKEQIRNRFYSSYVQTYLQRDVKDILNISNDALFYNFLSAIAARTGQVLNYVDLARDLGIDAKTVKAWIAILETSGIVYILQPYFNNLNKRLIKAPKIYFLDTGLCAYLTKWPTSESLERGAMSGAILETYIFTEILKSYWHNGLEPYFYYYRDTDKKEIDLIIQSGDTLYPVEFKKTGTPSMTASKNFNALSKLGKEIGHGAVICFVDKITPLSQEVTAVPVSFI